LHSNGSVDAGFNPNSSGIVYTLAIQSDGKILMGGPFSVIGGVSRGALARLINTEPAVEWVSVTGSRIRWARQGSAPELNRVTFDISADAGNWFSEEASYVQRGWEVQTQHTADEMVVRAWGPAQVDDDSGLKETLRTFAPPDLMIYGGGGHPFGFNFQKAPEKRVVVEWSPDLSLWWPIGTNSMKSPFGRFQEESSVDATEGYYRLRYEP
jgi:hypothetical protein